jgi:tetratricopeptide (TPR) repeat protein
MSDEPKANMNLDPEMLAAYIDNRLTPEQRAEVEAQLARDPDSYAVLVESIKVLDEINVREAPRVPEQLMVRRWGIVGSVVAAAAAVVLVLQLQPDWLNRLRGEDPQIARLVAAVGEERYIEARLSGGFKYGPLRSGTRGAGVPSEQNLNLRAASANAMNQAANSAQGLRATGVAKLLTGDVDGAIAALEESVRRESSAAALSDLAAAYLARAKDSLLSSDSRLAFETATRALALDPDNAEALFNRALAAEYLRMTEAANLWEAVIVKTPPSGWRDEAQRRIDALRAKP